MMILINFTGRNDDLRVYSRDIVAKDDGSIFDTEKNNFFI